MNTEETIDLSVKAMILIASVGLLVGMVVAMMLPVPKPRICQKWHMEESTHYPNRHVIDPVCDVWEDTK